MDNGDWLDNILRSAIENRTSDIHFEPQKNGLIIRQRIDGILRLGQAFDKAYQDNVISKIKVMADMNITEHRIPQDGHFTYTFKEKSYNIRVSSLPTSYGEAIVLRLLSRDDVLIKLEYLGFLPDQLEQIQQLITNTSGMILTTGPTGSGKTNLLYSILHSLNKPEVNIVTLEDPIEYEIPMIRQSQINENGGVTFSTGLRTIVRQDPNIVMVGEMRDRETVEIALQASLTGILIFSTFHTFDIPSLVARLIEMGSSPAVISQAIVGVVSTRLIRMVCDACKMPYPREDLEKLTPFIRKSLGVEVVTPTMQKGKGCPECKNTGYKGRTGIFEIVFFDSEIKALIADKQPSSLIYKKFAEKNIKGLHQVAKEKILAGVTTPEEVLRVLGTREN